MTYEHFKNVRHDFGLEGACQKMSSGFCRIWDIREQ